jgi:hypothetical protein
MTPARILAALATAAAFAAVMAPAAALADDGASVVIQRDQVTLTAHILVTVPVTVTCNPLDIPLSFAETGFQVEQAVDHGTAIAQASGYFANDPSVCDGSPHTMVMQGLAVPSGPPFRRGNAILTATFSGCTQGFPQTCVNGTSGPTLVALRRP